MKKRVCMRLVGCSGLVAIAIATAPARSQTASEDQAQVHDGRIEDIVVTARRTEENLQTTPVAVSATTGEALKRAQVNDVVALQSMAPSLSIAPGVAQPAAANIGIRGQISTDALIAVDNAVGLYFDGVYIARSSGSLMNLVDVSRIEVLRGPQGTLFGRNTTGGAINIISNQPTGELEGSVKLRYGNYDTAEATVVVNVPMVNDELALRMVYQHSQRNGFGRNTLLNEDLNDENTDFARATLRVAPDGAIWSLSIAGDITDRTSNGSFWRLISFSPAGSANRLPSACATPPTAALCPYSIPGDGLSNYVNAPYWQNRGDREGDASFRTYGISATADVDLDFGSLRSISAYRNLKTRTTTDLDGTPYSMVGPLTIVHQNQFSQEFQLFGKAMQDRLNWIVGLYHFKEEGLDSATTRSLVPLTTATVATEGQVMNKSQSAYGQLTFGLTDTLRITGGTRYTEDARQLIALNRSTALNGVMTCQLPSTILDQPGTCRGTQRRKFSYWSYLASLDWQASQNLFFYAKTSRAYRAGGFNTRTVLPGFSSSFSPERVTDYEIGTKLDLLDRRLRLNLAAYRTNYTNIQRSIAGVSSTGTLTSLIQNAASAKIQGAEVEVIARPSSGLTLTGSYGYTDPQYKRFVDGLGRDLSSQPFILVPKHTLSVGADQLIETAAGELRLHGDYSYRSRAYFGSYRGASQKGYGLFNAQIGLKLERPAMEVTLYGRNLFNRRYYARILGLEDSSFGTTSGAPGDPRTYGISVSHSF